MCFDALIGECRGWVHVSSGGKELPIQLAVTVNDQAVSRVERVLRPDVAKLGLGSGRGGFRFLMPSEGVGSSDSCLVHLYDAVTGVSIYRGAPEGRIGQLITSSLKSTDHITSWDEVRASDSGIGSVGRALQPPVLWEPLRLMPVYVGEQRLAIGSLIMPLDREPRPSGKDCGYALTRLGLIPGRGQAWQIAGLWPAGPPDASEWQVQVDGTSPIAFQISATHATGGAEVLAAEGSELLVRNWSPTRLRLGVVTPIISTGHFAHEELTVVSYCLVDEEQRVHWAPARVRLGETDLYDISGEAPTEIDTQAVRSAGLLESLGDRLTKLWEVRGIEAAVSEAYWLVLGRGPDSEGLEANARSVLAASVDLGKRGAIVELAEAMQSSPEYRSRSLDVLCEPARGGGSR